MYRITGGVTFILIALNQFGTKIPPVVLGVFAIIAGISLILGL